MPPPSFKDHADIFEEIGMLLEQVSGTEHTTGLLIGGTDKNNVAFELGVLALEREQRHELHNAAAFVVDRAAAPNDAVLDRAAERRLLP